MAVVTLDYGKGIATLHGTDAALADPTRLVGRLRQVFEGAGFVPPTLPAVAIELLELSRKPDVSFPAVRRVMEHDPLIAAKVLRAAQSAAYSGSSGAIRTLDDALVRLGLRTLSLLFLEAAMRMRVFRAPGFDAPMLALGRHSAATAHVARHLARRTSLFDEHTFLCGLLHDVGIAAGIVAIGPIFGSSTPPPFDEIWPAARDVHEMASDAVCRAWNLPPEIALVVGHHHSVVIKGHPHPVAAMVEISDWIVTELGYGLDGDVEGPPPPLHLAALGIDGRELGSLVNECRAVAANADT